MSKNISLNQIKHFRKLTCKTTNSNASATRETFKAILNFCKRTA